MDAADEPANRVKTEDSSGEPGRDAKHDTDSGRATKAQRDKALDDLMEELFFELDRAENEGPRNWLQLERRRAKRSG